MIATLKRSSLAVSKHLGLTTWVADSAWRRQRLLILCYHGISLADEHEWNPALYMSPATLQRRLDALGRARCNVLPLDEAVQHLYAGTLPPRAVTITFDDGFHDFEAKAYPLLRARGYPSTLYVTTQRVEENHPVPHLLASYLLWRHRSSSLDARGIPGLGRVYPLGLSAERERVVRDLRRHMHRAGMYPPAKDAYLRGVLERLGVDYDAVCASRILRLMTPEAVGAMSRRGVAIELHTHRHRTPENPRSFIDEVRLNREKLIEITGRMPRHFCYPSGVYRATYLPALEEEGIQSATTCDPELASRASHRLLLPRFVDNELVDDVAFEAWITGAACWLPRRTRRANGSH